MDVRSCLYCRAVFTPNKYSPRQKVCAAPECQKKRQLESMRRWRDSHPNYFKYDESKGGDWLDTQRQRSRSWREKNPEKVRAYRQKHLEEYRRYMRDYMRRLREKKRSSPEPGGSVSTPPNE